MRVTVTLNAIGFEQANPSQFLNDTSLLLQFTGGSHKQMQFQVAT